MQEISKFDAKIRVIQNELEKYMAFTINMNLVFTDSMQFMNSSLDTLVNTLTANYEYSRSKTDNLPLPVQMQLSEKPEIFSPFFIAFLESALNFEHFETKTSRIAPVFLKLLTPKDVFT